VKKNKEERDRERKKKNRKILQIVHTLVPAAVSMLKNITRITRIIFPVCKNNREDFTSS